MEEIREDLEQDNEKPKYPPSEEEFQELITILGKQQAFIEEITNPPLVAVTIANVTEEKTAIISYDGRFVEVTMDPALKDIVYPGLEVFMDEQSKTIVKLSTRPYTTGISCTVERILEYGYAEVDASGRTIKVFNPLNAELGDRVSINKDETVIVDRLPRNSDQFKLNNLPNMSWDDVGGLHKAKKDLIEAIEYPYMYPELYKAYGRASSKGVLLYGPPGCGKTMLAKVTANRIANIHGRDSVQTGYIYVKGPEVLSPWVGKAEATIRQLFLHAKLHREQYGYPAVIFIDEAESILSKRGTGISSDMEKTIVPMFLSEMDGIEESGAFVMLATNRPDVLDPAVIRDGRIDRKIKIDRPDEKAAYEIFMVHMKNTPVFEPADILSNYGAGMIFSDETALYKILLKTKDANNNKKCRLFRMSEIVTGAMIYSSVQNAIGAAIERDREKGIVSGVKREDLLSGIKQVRTQAQSMSLRDELKEFMKPFQEDVDKVEKL